MTWQATIISSTPGFQPEDMDKLPGLYRTIIDDPAALHDKFKQAKGRCIHIWVYALQQ